MIICIAYNKDSYNYILMYIQITKFLHFKGWRFGICRGNMPFYTFSIRQPAMSWGHYRTDWNGKALCQGTWKMHSDFAHIFSFYTWVALQFTHGVSYTMSLHITSSTLLVFSKSVYKLQSMKKLRNSEI